METTENKKTNRLSFNKKDGDLTVIDQQHLSNCWWFLKIFRDEEGKDARELVKRQLVERFNGQLFLYRPHILFIEEIKALEEMGMLHEVTSEFNTFDIIFKEKKIGEIRFTEAYR